MDDPNVNNMSPTFFVGTSFGLQLETLLRKFDLSSFESNSSGIHLINLLGAYLGAKLY
jgi:hypothetical protein